MIRKTAVAVLAIVFFACILTLARYSMWRTERIDSLSAASQVVNTRVGPIEYVLEGQEGPILLFIHGTPGGYDQAPADFEGFRILAPSRPGYLSTPIEVGRTPAEQADAHLALLDALDIHKVIVLGASGGGPSAITFAATHPERVHALVAMEAVGQSMELLEAPGFMSSDFFFWLVFNAIEAGPGFEVILSNLVPNPENLKRILDDPEVFEKIAAVLWSGWPPSLRYEGFDNDKIQFGNLALPLDEVSVPTLVVHGTEDINVPFAHAELLAAQILSARLHAITGADHMMPFTHGEEVRAALRSFLTQIED